MLKKLQEKAGFVSLETLIVTGVVIALGVYALTQYNDTAKIAIDNAMDKLAEVILIKPMGADAIGA